MKLKHISALLFLLFAFSIYGVAQVEDEATEDFSASGTRSIGAANLHDFGVIKEATSFTIEIMNKERTNLQIGDISIPDGVGVTITKKVIKPGEKGGIVVTIDPQYMKSGDFKRKLVISTITQDAKGTVITKTASYKLKGQVL